MHALVCIFKPGHKKQNYFLNAQSKVFAYLSLINIKTSDQEFYFYIIYLRRIVYIYSINVKYFFVKFLLRIFIWQIHTLLKIKTDPIQKS